MARNGVFFSIAARPQDFLKEAIFSSNLDLVHLHWVHPIGKNFVFGFLKFLGFQLALLVFRLRRIPIFWTIHNLAPHERKYIWLDNLNNWLLSRQIAGIFVHGRGAIPLVSKLLSVPEARIHCALHGNYSEITANLMIQGEKKRSDTLSECHFLYFGQIRMYKGVLELVKIYAASKLKGTLTIVGHPKDVNVRTALQSAASDERIRLLLDYVDDDVLVRMINEADLVVLPFHDVFTSGSLVMAITVGKPVITPRIGLVTEYVGDDCAFFFTWGGPSTLEGSLLRAAECDRATLSRMGQAARVRAALLNWDQITRGMVKIYLQTLLSG